MRQYRLRDVQIHTHFKVDARWKMSVSLNCTFPHVEKVPDTHWTGGRMGLMDGLVPAEKKKILLHPPRIELRFLGRPACNLAAILPEIIYGRIKLKHRV
jgi:hypothetical protein